MEYLFDCWESARGALANKYMYLFLDYDGTLAPISQTPAQAQIPFDTKDLLKKLVRSRSCDIAIISGRSVSDIKSMVGIEEAIYAGNHGLEVEGLKGEGGAGIPAGYAQAIGHIVRELTQRFSGINGVLIEDKGVSISVHYRLVDANNMQKFLSIFTEITERFAARGEIKITSGKKVYEIMPPVEWNKGTVVLWLLARKQLILGKDSVFPVYLGDDLTDEDAFKALTDKGMTVLVGEAKTPSHARYYLKDVLDVAEFLRRLVELKN